MNTYADAGKGGSRARFACVSVFAVVVGMTVLTGCAGLVSDGTESYRPPAARIVGTADCALPDTVHRLQFGENNSGDNVAQTGSLPAGFAPSRAVVCELAEDADGSASVDAVSLQGDVAAFATAINRPSEQPDGNTSYSCAYETKAPAAVYLVSPAGAVRMHWPSVVCGLSDDPLRPLEALVETGRARAQDLGRLGPHDCKPSRIVALTRTSKPDAPEGGSRRPTMRLPDRDVMGLTACTYRVTRGLNGEVSDTAVTSRARLSSVASTQLVREVLAAPEAGPCDLDATLIVGVDLYRINGSGGGELNVETDGCRRLAVRGLIGYRQTSGDVTALLRQASEPAS